MSDSMITVEEYARMYGDPVDVVCDVFGLLGPREFGPYEPETLIDPDHPEIVYAMEIGVPEALVNSDLAAQGDIFNVTLS